MREQSSIPNKQTLSNYIKRFCDMYDFDIEDFKKNNEKSGKYHFSGIYSDLLSLMLKNQPDHPMSAANASMYNVDATELKKYYKKMIDGVDELPEDIKKIIYAQAWHLNGDEISFWMVKLVEQLSRFIVNIVNQPDENLGMTLAKFVKVLDDMNFSLFNKWYIFNVSDIRQKQRDSNENQPIDNGIAHIIHKLMNIEKQNQSQIDMIIENSKTKNRKDICKEIFKKVYKIDNLECYYKTNKKVVEHVRCKREKWQTFSEYLKSNPIPQETGSDKKIPSSFRQWFYMQHQYETEEERKEIECMVNDMINRYNNYIEGTKPIYKAIYKIANRFIGSAITICHNPQQTIKDYLYHK